jgi:Domain of unknown function (DUF4371)
MLAHDVQRQNVCDIDRSPFIRIIAGGTTFEDGMEQFCISSRYLEVSTFVLQDAFLGFYNPNNSTADAMTSAMVDVMLQLNILLAKLKTHSFARASNLSGRLNGVQAQLKAMQSKSVYVHCTCHSLDMALQEITSDVPIIRDSFSLIKDCANVFASLQNASRSYG